MGIFNIRDVLEFAIRIEENGEAFYREAAKNAVSGETKAIFTRLADDEFGHKAIFQGIKDTIGDYKPNETYEGEYIQYLHEYIDGKAVFTDGIPDAAKDAASALDFAMQRELDSVLYYQEVKQFVSERHHQVIDKIIQEERKHFAVLSKARKNLK